MYGIYRVFRNYLIGLTVKGERFMKEIYRKMRKRAFAGRVLGGLCMIALAAVLVFAMEEELTKYVLTRADLFETPADFLKNEGFYKCDNNLLLGCYGGNDDGNYYVTPVNDSYGNGTYMGFYVFGQDTATAEQIINETWDYESGGESPVTSLSGRGYVYDMDATEKQYFREWFESSGADDTILENLCYKTYVLVPTSEAFSGSDILWLALAAVLCLSGIWLILSFVTGTYKGGFKKTMKERNISAENMVYDYRQAVHLKNIDIGKKYSILYGVTPKLLIHDDVVWAYLNITNTRHMLYGVIPTGTTKTYCVYFIRREGKDIEFTVKKEQQGHEVLEAFAKAAPYCIVGYDDNIKEMKERDFRQLVEIVETRKADLLGSSAGFENDASAFDNASSGFDNGASGNPFGDGMETGHTQEEEV